MYLVYRERHVLSIEHCGTLDERLWIAGAKRGHSAPDLAGSRAHSECGIHTDHLPRLCAAQHHLGYQDVEGVSRAAPGEISTMLCSPGTEISPECLECQCVISKGDRVL